MVISYDVPMTNDKKWKYISLNNDDIEYISDQLNISKLLGKVLNAASFTQNNIDDLDRFLDPKMTEITSFEGLTSKENLDASIDRIKKAVKNKEKIMINGDPDADGISGTAILATGLRALGLSAEYSFPIRSREGHGLQLRIIQEAKDAGISLIITTDCGTKDVQAVNYANELGIDVIITDHHILGKDLPAAVAIINPYMNKDESQKEYRYLSGSYVSFKWIMALKDALDKNFSKQVFECLVICASLGVISDRVSLMKPMNRAVVKLGIDYLNATKLIGMKALKEISTTTKSFLRARDISRTIAPRMNAPGRIGDPELGIPDSSIIVDLLMAGLKDIGPRSNIKQFIEKYKKILIQEKEIKTNVNIGEQVEIVDGVNEQRKRMTEEIAAKIEEIITEYDLEKERVIIVKGHNWNSGVIGIDADRLRDRFALPAIVITSLEGSEFLKGSVRSIPTINMYNVMEKVQKTFEEKYGNNPYQVKVETLLGERYVNAFGGHALACGFSMHQDDLPKWDELVRAEMSKILDTQFEFAYHILKDVEFHEVNHKLLLDLDTVAPFGEGFDYPVFCLKKIVLSSSPRPFGNRMQKDRTPHVEFKLFNKKELDNSSLKQKQRFLKATGFGLWEKFQDLTYNISDDQRFDIIFTIDYPHKGSPKKVVPRLLVLDIKKSGN